MKRTVVGVGMTKFEKPGRQQNFDYPDMVKEAGTKALEDAGLSYDSTEQACVGYVYGKAAKIVDNGDNIYGGKYVINPNGGLISQGHPLGATGLAQCAELCWQFRGMADKQQVNDAKLALQRNIGPGGAAVVDLYKLGFPQKAASRIQTVTVSSVAPENFKCNEVFSGIKDFLAVDGANIVKKMNGIFCFQVKGASGEGVWIVDCKNGNGCVKFGDPAKGDVTIAIADQDLVDLMTGKLNPQAAFFQGKLKIQGNTGLAMKLKDLKVPEGVVKSKGASTGDSMPTPESKPGSEFKVSEIFSLIKAELDRDGANIVKKMKGVFCFHVKNKDGKDGIWIVDAKNGNGSVSFGGPAKGDVTIVMSDEDMFALMSGKLNPQSAFFQGKLKIQGNMGLAMKLKEIQPKGQSKL